MNVIKWTNGRKRPPRRLIPLVKEIQDLRSQVVLSFNLVKLSANVVVDFLTKIGADRKDTFIDFS